MKGIEGLRETLLFCELLQLIASTQKFFARMSFQQTQSMHLL